MNYGKTVFAQLMELLPKYEFDKCVNRYHGHYKVQRFSCWEQFLVMCFAQLTYRESLRDIEACLSAVKNKLYHSGIRSHVSRSTLADANENRDWRIYSDFAHVLIMQARPLYLEDNDFSLTLKNMVYAFDSTTIDLCLTLFPWARFRKHKAAVKLHTLLDLRGSIPTFVAITSGDVHDVNALDLLNYEAGAFYIMDKGYVDYSRLYAIEQAKAYFVTRAKENFAFKRVYSNPVNKKRGVICDQLVNLTGYYAAKDYPDKIRRIKYHDEEKAKTFIFLTNNQQLAAVTIAALYKERWKVELFFRWMKQHLRIKAFYGTTTNAVYTQVWIAITMYLLVAIMKKKLNMEKSIYTILQILSVSLFEKMSIRQAFQENEKNNPSAQICNQLNIFE